jgi:hypothetical protein
LVKGPINIVRQRLREPRGEYVIVCGPLLSTGKTLPDTPTDEKLARLFGHITETSGVGKREAIRQVAEEYGLRAREVYQALERAKSRVS